MTPTQPNHTFLLFLSGAGLPAWVWDQTRAALPDPGTVAPRPSAGSSVSDYARAALDAVPPGPLTLIAHSSGGVVATEMAAQAPQRVHALLAVAAVIPLAGKSFTASLPFPQRLVLPVLLRVLGTRPPESTIRKSLAAGVDPHVVDRLVQDFTAEPRAYFTTSAQSGVMPIRGYLATTDDTELPLALQDTYADRLAPTARFTLPGGHLPMLTEPSALAQAITAFKALADN